MIRRIHVQHDLIGECLLDRLLIINILILTGGIQLLEDEEFDFDLPLSPAVRCVDMIVPVYSFQNNSIHLTPKKEEFFESYIIIFISITSQI